MRKDMELTETDRDLSRRKTRCAALLLAAAMLAAGCGGQKDAAQTAAPVEDAASGDAEGASEETGAASRAGAADGEAQVPADGAEAGEASVDEEEGADPRAVYEAVAEAVDLPSMMEGDDDFISNYYGIDPETLDGYVFASAEDATLADSVIIMRVKSEDAVDGMVDSLNTVLAQKAAEMEDYIPEQYEIVSDSSVKTQGRYVYLVISEQAGDIEAVIASSLK